MDRKDRRRKQKNVVKDTFRMVNTILLVVIAIAIVAFVAIFIKSQLTAAETGETSFLSGLFDREEESTEESTAETITIEAMEEEDTSDGFHETKDGRLYCLKDGEKIKGTWLQDGTELFCFDNDGYLKTGTFDEDAFRFETSGNGAVKYISFNKNYRIPTENAGDYPYAVKSSALMAFLNPQNTLGRMVQIMYKKTTETMSHQLGGTQSPQYTVPGSCQVAGGYVFWLPAIADPDEVEALTANKLFRMRPGDEKRQVAAENVSGYKVLEDANGNVTIYYCADGVMHVSGGEDFTEDDTAFVFTEDMEYVPDTSEEGKLYLTTESGYRVTMASEKFCVGDYAYQLSASGEILSVAPQASVVKEEYSYEFAADEAFGVIRSAAIRKKGDVQEVISGEFFGSTGNVHLAKDGSCVYAEYRDAMGNARILRLTFEGDVDIVNGFDPGEKEIVLCGNAGSGLIVKVIEETGDRYETVTTEHMTPLALGIEPMEIVEGEPETTYVEQGPGNISYEGPDAARTDPGIQYSAPGQPILPGSSVGKAP